MTNKILKHISGQKKHPQLTEQQQQKVQFVVKDSTKHLNKL